MAEIEELEKLAKDELYELAQKADLPGRSDMTKKELAKALSEASDSDAEDWSHSGERSETGRAIWTGAITFGLITIPVGLYTATEDRDISFHLLTGDDHSRVRNQRVSAETGKEVEWEELVRGFEYESGRYVVFTDEELDKIPSESQRVVDVVQFTDQDQIDPVYFERSYYVAPADTGVKAYKVLTGALEESGRVGVGKVTIRS
ncbi:MAG: Ku protein, partial [Acidimicrobiia bacterium]